MKYILTIIFLFVTYFAFSQHFEETYGGVNSDRGLFVEQALDGNYIVVGEKYYSSTKSDIHLIKIDSYGDTIWTRDFGTLGNDKGSCVKQTADKGYIICGTDSLNFAPLQQNTDIYIVKTDSNGVVNGNNNTWQQILDFNNLAVQPNTYPTSHDVAHSLCNMHDNAYAITGVTDSLNNGDEDAFLLILESGGFFRTKKTYGGNGKDITFSIKQTFDKGFILVGSSNSFSLGGDLDIYVIKTDSLGLIMWDTTYGGNGDDVGYSIEQTIDSNFVITGYTTSFGNGDRDLFFMKIGPAGDSLQFKRYGYSTTDEGKSIREDNINGGFIIAGFTETGISLARDAWVIKIDNNGDSTWSVKYGGVLVDEANSISLTFDGGYIFTGYTNSFGSGAQDIYVVKMNSNGSLTSDNLDIIKDNQNKKLEKIVDILGRETKPIKSTFLFYIYDDGTVEKIFIR